MIKYFFIFSHCHRYILLPLTTDRGRMDVKYCFFIVLLKIYSLLIGLFFCYQLISVIYTAFFLLCVIFLCIAYCLIFTGRYHVKKEYCFFFSCLLKFNSYSFYVRTVFFLSFQRIICLYVCYFFTFYINAILNTICSCHNSSTKR